ncbi:hypothetical protein CP354_07900 [Lactobacillus sp. UMNPBX3]|nr:hypothetical protein CP354_07900 [Lactobacillus sp. UMNPBX3]
MIFTPQFCRAQFCAELNIGSFLSRCPQNWGNIAVVLLVCILVSQDRTLQNLTLNGYILAISAINQQKEAKHSKDFNVKSAEKQQINYDKILHRTMTLPQKTSTIYQLYSAI